MCLALKSDKAGGWRVSGQEHWLLFQRSRVDFPATTNWLTIILKGTGCLHANRALVCINKSFKRKEKWPGLQLIMQSYLTPTKSYCLHLLNKK